MPVRILQYQHTQSNRLERDEMLDLRPKKCFNLLVRELAYCFRTAATLDGLLLDATKI